MRSQEGTVQILYKISTFKYSSFPFVIILTIANLYSLHTHNSNKRALNPVRGKSMADDPSRRFICCFQFVLYIYCLNAMFYINMIPFMIQKWVNTLQNCNNLTGHDKYLHFHFNFTSKEIILLL